MPNPKRNAPISLLLVPRTLAADCANRQWLDCAVSWQRRGRGCAVAAADGPLRADYARSGVSWFPLSTGPGLFGRWRRVRGLAELVRANRPQKIWVQNPDDLAALRRLSTCAGVRCFVAAPPGAPRAGLALRELARRGGQIVADSAFGAGELHRRCGLDPAAVTVLRPAIDAQAFAPGHVSAERALKLAGTWRVPEGAALALHIGPLRSGGGQTAALEALARLGRRDLFLVFLGQEAERGIRQQLLAQVERLNLLEQTLLVEGCADLAAALWFAHMVLAVGVAHDAVRPELLAAQAMGRPVIVSAAGAQLELVAPGVTAWATPPGDSAALAAAMTEVMDLSMQERLRLAVKMQAFVAENFAYSPWLEAMLDDDGLAAPASATPAAA